MSYIIKIQDITGDHKPDLYYKEIDEGWRHFYKFVNEPENATRYKSFGDAKYAADISGVVQLAINYNYCDLNLNFDSVPEDAIKIVEFDDSTNEILESVRSLNEIRNQMKRLVEDINGDTITVYLIVDRYEKAEFYDIFGNGIYTDLQQAQNDYEKALQEFKNIGPDDCHTFSLYQCDLNKQDMQELKDQYNHYISHPDYSYNNNFTSFMERICRNEGKELLSWTV